MTIVGFLKTVDAVIINPILEILFAVAFVYFLYAVIKLVNADGTTRGEARNAVMWSVVGMFIMVSVYGIITLILNSFEIDDPNSTSFIQGKL